MKTENDKIEERFFFAIITQMKKNTGLSCVRKLDKLPSNFAWKPSSSDLEYKKQKRVC